ncbi:unnamed protein product [Anisakis simplex]|uniref:Uncharacterized protein n=1 Tax=Anisakis simplex TaxID=6269 RepID=A0A3P6N6S3_ANISI|nr:unnamed protein product [Anisakis simplex]
MCNDYAKSPPVNGIQHSGVHRVDPAPVCDDVPVENDSVWERYKRQSLSEDNKCDNFHQLYHHCPPMVKNCDPDTGKPYNERAIN